MTEEILDLLLQLPAMVIIFSAVPLLASLVIGLFCGVFQAATQIQEQSLVYAPKLLGVVIIVFLFGSSGLSYLLEYWHEIFQLLCRV